MKRSALICATALTAALAIPTVGNSASGTPTPPIDDHTEYVAPGATAPPESAVDGGRGAGAPAGSAPQLFRGGGGGGSKTLKTGFGDPLYLSDNVDVRQRVMDETTAMNGDVVRLDVYWRGIAPGSPGPSFDPTDPASPEYSWGGLDAAVRDANARGLDPILMIFQAPDWAEGANRPADAVAGSWKPNPKDVADFGKAIARRYSGSFGDLPRVRNFMLWNEPNLPSNLSPQWKGKKPLAPAQYVKMLNAFYTAVHGVTKSNQVITAGTAPYGFPAGEYSMRPLLFWREALCVSDGKKPKATKCKDKPKFDVLAHHPIDTSGGPTVSAIDPDDISTPDLHNLVDVLRAAERGHNTGTSGRHPVWATEIWWESNPPDNFKLNPSLAVQAKWYEEALYSLWNQGASTVLFYQVRDEPHYGEPGRFTGSSYETGVYFVDDTAKPSKEAVRFPFIGDRKSKDSVLLWGIAPESGKLTVTQKGSGPKKIASLNVKSGRIFTKTVKLHGKHKIQATVSGDSSLSYPVK